MAAKRWKKILYEDQGVPDHYVDDSFLDELKKNLHIRTYDYWPVVKESGVVTQQLCSVCIFVMVFVCMDVKLLAAETLVWFTAGLTIAGYGINYWLTYTTCGPHSRSFLDDFKPVLIFAGISYSLSPVLVSLTETIATDTIYAMTAVMLLANLCFHDYGADAEMVSGVLSLNAALFASVCLASRLHSNLHSFATVTFAVQVFALWPALRRNLRQHIPSCHNILTVALGVSTAIALSCMSVPAAVLFTIVSLFITFVCPAWLISIQPYKKEYIQVPNGKVDVGFRHLDKNNDGVVAPEEFGRIINTDDKNGDGCVSKDEYEDGAESAHALSDLMFGYFDSTGTGCLTSHTMVLEFSKADKDVLKTDSCLQLAISQAELSIRSFLLDL